MVSKLLVSLNDEPAEDDTDKVNENDKKNWECWECR